MFEIIFFYNKLIIYHQIEKCDWYPQIYNCVTLLSNLDCYKLNDTRTKKKLFLMDAILTLSKLSFFIISTGFYMGTM